MSSPTTVPGQPQPTAATWTRKDLLDTDTLTRDEVELILTTSETMLEVRSRPMNKLPTLRGATVFTLFYEQSTRTRASFEVAGKALGADVVNITASGSSIEKGESLIDTVRTIERVGADLIVMRHPSSGAPYLAAQNSAAGIINGGDGQHAHPTQALLDLFTIRRHLGDVTDRRVAIVGDVRHSRVARSNLWLLSSLGARVVLCAPRTLLPATLGSTVPGCSVTTHLDEALDGADVVMALRMQRERQQAGLIPSLREYINGYQLTEARLAMAAPGALVMHPGPMNEGIEITPAAARAHSSVIEEQVSNGVAVRMAILYLMAAGRHG